MSGNEYVGWWNTMPKILNDFWAKYFMDDPLKLTILS
jgi:hypothetical protein